MGSMDATMADAWVVMDVDVVTMEPPVDVEPSVWFTSVSIR